MLIVHHGLIWGGISYIRGIVKKRIEFLLKKGISLYAAHLPLNAHRGIGNNAIILKKIGADPEIEFGEYRGVKIGYMAKIEGKNIKEIADAFNSATLLYPPTEQLLFSDLIPGYLTLQEILPDPRLSLPLSEAFHHHQHF